MSVPSAQLGSHSDGVSCALKVNFKLYPSQSLVDMLMRTLLISNGRFFDRISFDLSLFITECQIFWHASYHSFDRKHDLICRFKVKQRNHRYTMEWNICSSKRGATLHRHRPTIVVRFVGQFMRSERQRKTETFLLDATIGDESRDEIYLSFQLEGEVC